MSDASSWERVQAICESALQRASADRAPLIAQLCDGDDELRREVESLVRHQAAAATFLTQSTLQQLAYAAVEHARLPPGHRLGPYEILEWIAAGGMGDVYKARDSRLGRIVAIKTLSEPVAGDAEEGRPFEREAHLIARLNHPHICTLFDVGVDVGTVYLVIEFLEGQSLAERLKSGPLSIDEAVQISLDVADALKAAHQAGVIHRDLKPANVMLTPAGAKLLDFGIASCSPTSFVTGAVARSRADTHNGGGTPRYMAPEQLLTGNADERSDLYALGAVLYEMFTGQNAFGGSTPATVHDAILRTRPAPMCQVNPSVPRAADAIVTKLLHKQPEGRYDNAAQVHDALTALQRARGVGKRRARMTMVIGIVVASAIGIAAWQLATHRRVTSSLFADIERLLDAGEYAQAALLMQTARTTLPTNDALSELWQRATTAESIQTDPPDADVEIRPYDSQSAWEHLGRSPLTNVRLPRSTNVWRVSKDGYAPVVFVRGAEFVHQPGFHATPIPVVRLRPLNTVPPDMVVVTGGEVAVNSTLLGTLATAAVRDFLIDRHEVTNAEYQRFVDAGGYRDPKYWTEPFFANGQIVPWAVATSRFVDTTGTPGPATWVNGRFPTGAGRYPVAGVSWYESVAYAAFVGKQLPTAFHWTRASQNGQRSLAAAGNFRGSATLPVDRPGVLSGYGTTDMAGNVKEWCFNEGRGGKRLILGGGFGEPSYAFGELDEQSPWERRPNFGLRTMKLDAPPPPATLTRIESKAFDAVFSPVSDAVFSAFRGLYEYDHSDLNARVEETQSTASWTRQRVTFDAPYADERIILQLFLPKQTSSPFQVVVYAPGGFAVSDAQLNLEDLEESFAFLLKSGRALAAPIYKGTYDRRDGLTSGGQPAAFYRDHVIMMAKDLRRSLDYLTTRPDVDATKIGYYGSSMGAQLAPIFLAVEPRISAAVLDSGGFPPRHDLPEIDRMNFAPRVRAPVLMLNGRFDASFPLESAQLPLFRLLGTPPSQKRHVLFDAGHGTIPHRDQVREVLAWLNHYLGPTARELRQNGG